MGLEIQRNPVSKPKSKQFKSIQTLFLLAASERIASNTLILIECYKSWKNNHDAESLKRSTKWNEITDSLKKIIRNLNSSQIFVMKSNKFLSNFTLKRFTPEKIQCNSIREIPL